MHKKSSKNTSSK